MVEWTETTPFDTFDGIKKWNGKGENFDFIIRQYESGWVVGTKYIKISNGARFLKEKVIGQFKSAEQAQKFAEQYDANKK